MFMTEQVDLLEFTGGWDYARLPRNIRLGNDCFLERRDGFGRFRSQLEPGLVLGDRVRVLTWTTFNVEPTGYVQVGDDTLLVGAVFMCAQSIVIGARSVVSYNVTLADSDFHPLEIQARRQDAIANAPQGDRSQRPPLRTKPIVIGDDVWIGIGAIVLKGVNIGSGATIAPGAVLSCNVPPHALAAGNPATILQPDERVAELRRSLR
jgi:acetyltransferase-like isoleucine patch superfamily enzyme